MFFRRDEDGSVGGPPKRISYYKQHKTLILALLILAHNTETFTRIHHDVLRMFFQYNCTCQTVEWLSDIHGGDREWCPQDLIKADMPFNEIRDTRIL